MVQFVFASPKDAGRSFLYCPHDVVQFVFASPKDAGLDAVTAARILGCQLWLCKDDYDAAIMKWIDKLKGHKAKILNTDSIWSLVGKAGGDAMADAYI